MKLFSLFGELILKGSEKAENELKNVTEKAENADSAISKLTNTLSNMGSRLSSVGKSLSIGLTAPIVALGGGAFLAAKKYEDAVRSIQVATGATGEALNQFEKDMKSLAREVPNTVDEIVGAIGNLNTYTGATGDTLQELTKHVLDASRLLGEDGVANSQAFGKAMQQWQIDAKDGPQILDSLYKATQNYGVGLGEIIGLLNGYGPVMQNAGFTTEQTAEFFARLTSAGISVSRIMPAINSAFRNWAKEGKDSQEMLNSVITTIRNTTDSQQALALATEVFGAQGAQRLMTAIRNDIIPPIQEWGQTIQNVDGLIQQSAEENRTFAESFQIFKNNVEQSLEPFGKAMLEIANDVFPPVIDAISKVAEAFQNMNPAVRNTIVVVGGLLAAAGPMLIFFGNLTKSITTMIPVIRTLGAALSGLAANPIGAVIAAIGVLISLVPIVIRNWDNIREFFTNMWTNIQYTFQNAMDWIKIRILQWVQVNLSALSKLVGWIPGLGDAIEGAQEKISAMIDEIEMEKAARTSEKNMKRVKQSVEDAAESTDVYTDAIEKNTEMIQYNTESIQDNTKAIEDARRETIRNYDRMGDAIMTALRNQYREQEQLQRESLNRQIRDVERATNEKIKMYEREYQERLKILDDETNEAVRALQAEIDALNALTQAEEEHRENMEYLQKKAELEQKIATTRSSKERLQAQQELAEMIAERERQEILASRERRINELREEIQNIKNAAKEKEEEYRREFEAKKAHEEEMYAATKSRLEDEMEAVKNHFAKLQEEHNLMTEAMRLAERKHQDEMLQLLATYNPHWQDAGRSFGERMIDGLISTRESMRQTAMSLLTAVQPVFKELGLNIQGLHNQMDSLNSDFRNADFNVTTPSVKPNAPIIAGYPEIVNRWNSGKSDSSRGKQEVINVNVNARVLNRRDADAIGDSVVSALRTRGVNP